MPKETTYNRSQDNDIQSVDNIVLVHSGEDYFLRLRNIISKAQNEIHIQSYIFENDTTGLEIAEALKEAANRKVKVYVLLDGYGSLKLPNNFLENLKQNGDRKSVV
jgi:cardiolipin synthase